MRKQKPSIPTEDGTGAAANVTPERIEQIKEYVMDGEVDREKLAYNLSGVAAALLGPAPKAREASFGPDYTYTPGRRSRGQLVTA